VSLKPLAARGHKRTRGRGRTNTEYLLNIRAPETRAGAYVYIYIYVCMYVQTPIFYFIGLTVNIIQIARFDKQKHVVNVRTLAVYRIRCKSVGTTG